MQDRRHDNSAESKRARLKHERKASQDLNSTSVQLDCFPGSGSFPKPEHNLLCAEHHDDSFGPSLVGIGSWSPQRGTLAVPHLCDGLDVHAGAPFAAVVSRTTNVYQKLHRILSVQRLPSTLTPHGVTPKQLKAPSERSGWTPRLRSWQPSSGTAPGNLSPRTACHPRQTW